MVLKSTRILRSKIVRSMLSLSHYAFKERLRFKCQERGCLLSIVGEEYTTKTCGGCGNLKKMGGLKMYKCKKCLFVLDRDYNGARIFILKMYSQNTSVPILSVRMIKHNRFICYV